MKFTFAASVAVLGFLISCEGRQRSRESGFKFPRSSRLRAEILENLFNIYDPSFLAVVWPKLANGVHLSLEPECWDDLTELFRDLSEGRTWAYNVLDASGRYPAGVFGGNRYWLGSRDQCFELDNEFQNQKINPFDAIPLEFSETALRERYYDGGAHEWNAMALRPEPAAYQVATDDCPPHSLAYSTLRVLLNVTKPAMEKSYDITLGVCLPRSCPETDVTALVNFSIMINEKIKTNVTIPRIAKIKALRQIKEYHDIKSDISAIVLISVTAIIVAVVLAATVVDLELVKCRSHTSKSMSFDLQKYDTSAESEHKCNDDEDYCRNSCEALSRKDPNVLDTETLTINNLNNSNNINLVTVKKVLKPNAMPPSITLDVVSADKCERTAGSCQRCGKYRKQCSNPTQSENLSPCPRVKYNSFASLSTISTKAKFCKTLFLSFSLTHSWARIFNTSTANKELAIIHVLRIIATFWIIFIHVSVITTYISDDGDYLNSNQNVYYILATGTLAFDVLFFVSATFSSYHFFYLNHQYSVEELVNFGGICGQLMQLVCFVFNRVIRLLPSYAYVILLSLVVARVSEDTALLTLPEGDHHNCAMYWWRNWLYITIFYPKEQQCMQVSWYLSLETLLHVACVVLCGVAAWARVGAAAGVALVALLAATACDVATYSAQMHRISTAFEGYWMLIERPWARVTPYLVGVFVGWLLHRIGGKLNVSKVVCAWLWVAAGCAWGALCTVPWVWAAWAHAWLHAAAPAALLWPALACSAHECTRRLLDSPLVAGLSRLCYSALLVHGVLARAALLALHGGLGAGLWPTWSFFAGTLLLSLLAALLLALLIEMPCCSLLRRLSDAASR